MKENLQSKFAAALSEDELSRSHKLRSHVNMKILMARIQHLCGADFTAEAQRAFDEDPSTFEVLDTDLPELKAVVKQMNISLLSSAIAISLQAQAQRADRLFRSVKDW